MWHPCGTQVFPLPVLLLHGSADGTVPAGMTEDFAEAEKDAGESDAQVTEPVLAPAAAPMPAATRTDRRAAADAAVADTRRVFLHAQKLEKKAMQVLGVALRVYTHKCERIDEAQKRRNGACQLLKISETEHEWHLAQKAYSTLPVLRNRGDRNS